MFSFIVDKGFRKTLRASDIIEIFLNKLRVE